MITIEHITKTYGSFTAVSDLTFTARPGRVTGFLGPNGAGKSTTLKILCGLCVPTSGTAHINGRPFTSLALPPREVGVMLDASAQHPGRTGKETLTLAALASKVPTSAVGPALERMGLHEAATKRVGSYSLGMRQRLGLASALIGNPHTLVLDEPVNGLDPQGIHWMRELLRDFASDGGTVLLSSHLLSELQLIAQDIVVINRGTLVVSGPIEELRGSGNASLVRTPAPERLTRALTARGIEFSDADGEIRIALCPESIGQLALEENIVLTRLDTASTDLETAFLQLTA